MVAYMWWSMKALAFMIRTYTAHPHNSSCRTWKLHNDFFNVLLKIIVHKFFYACQSTRTTLEPGRRPTTGKSFLSWAGDCSISGKAQETDEGELPTASANRSPTTWQRLRAHCGTPDMISCERSIYPSTNLLPYSHHIEIRNEKKYTIIIEKTYLYLLVFTELFSLLHAWLGSHNHTKQTVETAHERYCRDIHLWEMDLGTEKNQQPQKWLLLLVALS